MRGKSGFPYRKYNGKPHPHSVRSILEESELTEVMREAFIQKGKPCPFCHGKLKEPPQERDLVVPNYRQPLQISLEILIRVLAGKGEPKRLNDKRLGRAIDTARRKGERK